MTKMHAQAFHRLIDVSAHLGNDVSVGLQIPLSVIRVAEPIPAVTYRYTLKVEWTV
jgi:hypothetical protein